MATGGRFSTFALPLMVGVVGCALTLGLAWAARTAHVENEDRLVEQRALEVEAVLTASIPSIETSLGTAAALVNTDPSDPSLFETVIGSQVGADGRFSSASVWSVGEQRPVTVIGDEPELAEQDRTMFTELLERAIANGGLTVVDLLDAEPPRLGYAFAPSDGRPQNVVYAEQTLPVDRTASAPEGSAFADLDFALYLDSSQRSGSLVIASTSELPLEGRQAEQAADFGDGRLRVVVSPKGNLGGSLLARLAWLVLGGGFVVTLAAVVLSHRLQHGRRQAEALAEERTALYAEQRAASVALQQSLLPRRLPEPAGLDIASRYSPGVSGTHVGGDWYDVMEVAGRTTVVVGDVSGSGLAAASVMAAVRHSIRALAYQGDTPEVILEKVNQPALTDLNGHFVTVLCGSFDLEAQTLSVATAGHPAPLVVQGQDSDFIDVAVGPPVGALAGSSYSLSIVPVGPGSTVVFFTDGLIERRHESLDAGLERLRMATRAPFDSAADLVDSLMGALADGSGHDDAAILAVRRTT